MPVGFSAINSSNTVQVDQDFSNLMLRTKGTFTFSSTSTRVAKLHTLTIANAITPVIFIGATSAPVSILRSYKSGSNWIFELGCSSAISVTYYIFDKISATSSTKGIQVFGSDGSLIFDSESKYQKIRYVNQLPTGAPNKTYTLPSGPTYAAALGYTRFSFVEWTGPDGVQWTLAIVEAVRVTATSVIVTDIDYQEIPDDFYNYSSAWSAPSQLMIIDVTGY